MESAKYIGHRSNSLITHASAYKNIHMYYNAILERFYYISIILDGSWLSPFSIGSMGESCVGTEVDHSISIEKHI